MKSLIRQKEILFLFVVCYSKKLNEKKISVELKLSFKNCAVVSLLDNPKEFKETQSYWN